MYQYVQSYGFNGGLVSVLGPRLPRELLGHPARVSWRGALLLDDRQRNASRWIGGCVSKRIVGASQGLTDTSVEATVLRCWGSSPTLARESRFCWSETAKRWSWTYYHLPNARAPEGEWPFFFFL